MYTKTTRAFTLIELLIVVAIIAILAAIAVPNFLEAQTRAKVSRFYSDVRNAGVALEAYRVDNNKYPWPDNSPPESDEALAGAYNVYLKGPAENYLPRALTTPIAYMSALPIDIFPSPNVMQEFPGIPIVHPPHFINDEFNQVQYSTPPEQLFSARTKAGLRVQREPTIAEYDRSVLWHMHSHGPDQDHDDFFADQGFPTAYDPTNGTVSDGDIFYFGPGHGFTKD